MKRSSCKINIDVITLVQKHTNITVVLHYIRITPERTMLQADETFVFPFCFQQRLTYEEIRSPQLYSNET